MARLDVARDLALQLHKLIFMMDRAAEVTLKSTHVSFAEFHLLLALRHHGTVSQKAVAQFRGLTEGAVSRKVDALIKQRLIIRVQNPANRREHLLTLTPIGRRRLLAATRNLTGAFTHVHRALTSSERRELQRLLGKLVATFWDDRKRLSCAPMGSTGQAYPS